MKKQAFTMGPSPRGWLAVAALCALPLAAHAHRTWLLPNATVFEGREPVAVVDAGVSEDLFVFERGLPVAGITALGPNGQPVAVENPSTARHRASVEVKLAQPGTYRISQATRSAMGSYKLGDETKRFRGSLDELDKIVPAGAQLLGLTVMDNRLETFVSYENPGKGVPPAATQGLALQPLDAVTDLSTGDRTRFTLLLDGKPLPDATLTLLRDGNRYRYKLGEVTLRTDAKGEFTVQWTEAGRYWLGVTHTVTKAPEGTPPGQGGTREQPLRRAGYSATFEVVPR